MLDTETDPATLHVALLFAEIAAPALNRAARCLIITDAANLAEPQQPIDLLVLKNVWSYADDARRADLLRFAQAHLSEDGILIVDYATLPGAALPATLQRIGLERAHLAAEAGALFFKANPAAAPTLDAMQGRKTDAALNVSSFAAVAHTMSEAGLHFAASARVLDGVPAMNFAKDAFLLLRDERDPNIRETKKDLMLNRGHRCDIFMRRVEKLSPQTAAERIAALTFRTTLPLERIEKLAVLTAYAESKPTPAARRLFEVLSKSPASALDLAERRVMGCENVWKNVESILVLMAMGAITPDGPI